MTPARYEIVDRFPISGSGKTDRRALAGSFRDRRPSTSIGDTLEDRSSAMRDLIAEVLCEAELDDSLSFFELGGDSMDAIELVASARRVGIDLRLEDVITGGPLGDVLRLVDERPMPRDGDVGASSTAESSRRNALAAFLETREWERIAAYYATRVAAPFGSAHSVVEDIWPLAPLQEGLIVQSLYDDTMPDIYTVQVCVEVDTDLDPADVREAVSRVVSAHPALRSAFVLDRSDEPVQVVLSEVATEVTVVDLPADAERSGAIGDWLLEDRRRRFDLTTPPLHRFALLRLGGARRFLVFTHHHALLDGWSVNIVLSDVLRICQHGGAAIGDTSIDGVSPRAFALWARDQLGPEARHAWHSALRDMDGLVLGPHASAATASSDAWSEEHHLDLTASETDLVSASAGTVGVTPATVVAGAWAAALGRATGRDEVTHGFVVSGRECP
ncbi:MAG: condensation domain-containing protein, partial [Pseudonocardiaceae bacterium]